MVIKDGCPRRPKIDSPVDPNTRTSATSIHIVVQRGYQTATRIHMTVAVLSFPGLHVARDLETTVGWGIAEHFQRQGADVGEGGKVDKQPGGHQGVIGSAVRREHLPSVA
jgi:hypothetical protein